jgi:hypothetical protein
VGVYSGPTNSWINLSSRNSLNGLVTSGLVLALDASRTLSYPATSAELITNGTFDSNVTGWTTTNSTNTWSSGKMQISRSGGDGRVSYQTFTTIAGQTYRVSAEVNSSGSRGDLYIYDGSGIGGTRFLTLLGTNGQTLTLTGTFTAISTITTLGFGVDANGTSIVVDNVSVSSTLWVDLSGLGNNGTLVNGPTYDIANGGSLNFLGTSSQYVTLGNDKFKYQDNFTVEAWARFPNLPNNPGSACGARYPIIYNHDYGYNLLIGSTGFANFQIYNTISANISINSLSSVVGSNFFHTVGIKSGTLCSLYVNGVLQATANLSTNAVYYQNFPFVIGGFATCGSDKFYSTGNIAKVSVYNKALTASEIQQNYNATRGRYGL